MSDKDLAKKAVAKTGYTYFLFGVSCDAFVTILSSEYHHFTGNSDAYK